MMIIGLLLIALICVALGVILPSAAWLIASLIATSGAGYLLWKARSTILAPVVSPTETTEAVSPTTAVASRIPAPPEHGDDTAIIPAVTASTTPGPPPKAVTSSNDEVWVIDGRPRYHVATCAIIQGQDAEPVPYSQATADGFMPCSLCEPNLPRADH